MKFKENLTNNELKAGAALNYALILLNALVGLVYTPYMLRMMGQSEYGLYSLVASVISYLTILDLGIGSAIIRYTAKFRAEGKEEEQYEMFGMFFILYFVIGLVAFLIGGGLYLNVDAMFGKTMTEIELSRAKIMMLILVFNLAFTFPMSIFGSIMTAYERFVFPRILSIIRVLLNTVVMIVLLHWGYRAVAMVIVQTVFNVLTLIINYLYCKYNIKIKMYFRRFNWCFLKEVAIFSFWIFLNVIMDKIYWSTGQFVLGAIAGTVAVSVFAVAIQLEGMYMQFSTAISSVFLPKVTALVTKDYDNKTLSDLFIKTGRVQYVIMSLIMCGFIILGRAFLDLWAGPDYSDAYIITLLFFLSLITPLIQNLGITILQAKNQMKFRSLLYIAIAIVALILEIVFGKLWGGIGCAAAIAGALVVGQGIVMNIYYYKKQSINIPLFWKEILKMSVAPFIVTIVFYILVDKIWVINSWLQFGLLSFVYFIAYMTSMYYFSMNNTEKEMIKAPLKKLMVQ